MLVNLDNVRKSIGRPVTESQKDEIIKDLEEALKDFTIREKESSAAAHALPLVTVNNRTNIVAIHSRLLHALELSVIKSVRRLHIPPDSGAFDQVGQRAKLFHFHFLPFSWQGPQMKFAKATTASTAGIITQPAGWTGSATT